jgi:Signal transduction histidine kinase
MAVRDSGIGIAAEDIPKLFTDFGMLEQARPLNKGGTGLGLAIARRLAHAMGGEILIDSTPGEGSRFALQLELAEAGSSAPSPGLPHAGGGGT